LAQFPVKTSLNALGLLSLGNLVLTTFEFLKLFKAN
jgi:hypothetical protein